MEPRQKPGYEAFLMRVCNGHHLDLLLHIFFCKQTFEGRRNWSASSISCIICHERFDIMNCTIFLPSLFVAAYNNIVLCAEGGLLSSCVYDVDIHFGRHWQRSVDVNSRHDVIYLHRILDILLKWTPLTSFTIEGSWSA